MRVPLFSLLVIEVDGLTFTLFGLVAHYDHISSGLGPVGYFSLLIALSA